jgi:phage tail sheath gpL-like
MPSVAFNEISSNIRTNTHHMEVDGSRAVSGAVDVPHKILVMGIKLGSGSVAELVPKQILSPEQAEAYWGVGSQIADAVAAAKAANSTTEMWGIGIDANSGGTAGTTTLTVTGTTTSAGTLYLYIGGELFTIAVASGDAANDIAAAINTQLQASTKYPRIAFTSGVSTNVVTLTMKWAGEEQPDVRFGAQGEELVAGITSIVVAEGTAGAGNPDVSEIITVMGDEPYETVIMPWTDATNLTALETEMLRRFGGMVQAEGVAFCADRDSHSNVTTFGNSRNSKHLCAAGFESALVMSPTWRLAAVVGATDAGETHPSRPRQTLQLPGVKVATASLNSKWTQAERNLLLTDGISTVTYDASGNVYIERLITTYQTNAQSTPDTTYLNVNTLRQLAYLRYQRRTKISLNFPRFMAGGPESSDDPEEEIPPGQPIVTVHVLRNHGLAQMIEEWVPGGICENDVERFKDEYKVFRDPTDRDRFQEQMGPNLMNQFRGLSGQIQFLL